MQKKLFLLFRILLPALFLLVSRAAVPLTDFYPFGNGAEEALPLPNAGACGYSGEILPFVKLPTPFNFGGKFYKTIYPSFHGFISLGRPAANLSCSETCDRNADNYTSLGSPHILIFERATTINLDGLDGGVCKSSYLLQSDISDYYSEVCKHPHGSVSHRLYNASASSSKTTFVFHKAASEIGNSFPGVDISKRIDWVYVLTYFNVTNNSPEDSMFGCNLGGRFNTYQLVIIATSHNETFLIFKYNQVQWLYESFSCLMANYPGNDQCCGLQPSDEIWGGPAQAGIRFPNNVQPPISLFNSSICSNETLNIAENSNIGVPGMFVLQVDAKEPIEPDEPWTTTPKPSITTTTPSSDWTPGPTPFINTTASPNINQTTCSITTDDNKCSCSCKCENEETFSMAEPMLIDQFSFWPESGSEIYDNYWNVSQKYFENYGQDPIANMIRRSAMETLQKYGSIINKKPLPSSWAQWRLSLRFRISGADKLRGDGMSVFLSSAPSHGPTCVGCAQNLTQCDMNGFGVLLNTWPCSDDDDGINQIAAVVGNNVNASTVASCRGKFDILRDRVETLVIERDENIVKVNVSVEETKENLCTFEFNIDSLLNEYGKSEMPLFLSVTAGTGSWTDQHDALSLSFYGPTLKMERKCGCQCACDRKLNFGS